MARTDTLGHFLTDVADAIREKKGTSETITASDFDTEIENLPSGGGDVSEYFTDTISSGLNTGQNGVDKMIKKIPSNIIVSGTSLDYAFQNLTYLEEIPFLDTSSITSMQNMFSKCGTIKTIPLLNTSSVSNMQSMFSYCTSLISIPLLDTSSVTTMYGMFSYCYDLTTIPLLDTSSVTNLQNMFSRASSLTNTSLDNILQMCINASNYTATKTLANLGFTATNYPVSRIQALPHYQDFIDAGWQIGYN